MSETEATSQKEQSRSTLLWAIGAIVCLAGFLSWLAMTTEPSQVQVVQENTGAEEGTGFVLSVPVDSFVATVDQYVDTGTRVRLSRIPVASRLGSRVFWTQLPGERPGFTATYLIALDSSLVSSDTAGVSEGATITVVGRVNTMTDSVLSEWIADGLITEQQRMEASFATTYLRAGELTYPGSGED